ncbi:hypothetical protein [Streptomyces purpurogeneiscleroticus]|uniref:hypothetical protein n=1 Tax=Streptomyces purpurogeneiscleroticus TaxID=68259 RepID=UPI001CBE0E81|nr:hypothetical protein [Streptomyces purpurogeneiscleroticus]MBZ4016622.1 hypothetical protein [Streptomyces purpurogeneiscleroticus]
MSTKYVARLQFTPDGAAVEGEWTAAATAEGRYTEWVGRYGSNPTVMIQLIEDTDGHECVVKTWTAQGEVEEPQMP